MYYSYSSYVVWKCNGIFYIWLKKLKILYEKNMYIFSCQRCSNNIFFIDFRFILNIYLVCNVQRFSHLYKLEI